MQTTLCILVTLCGWVDPLTNVPASTGPSDLTALPGRHPATDTQLVEIAREDVDYAVVAAEIDAVQRKYAKNALVETILLAPPQEIRGPATAKLFSKWRFFVSVWSQRARDPLPPRTQRPIGLLPIAPSVLAISDTGALYKFPNYWGIDGAADFLIKTGVKIESPEDARLVRDALCELFFRPKNGQIEEARQRVWQINLDPTNERAGSYEVQVNPDGTVKSMRYVPPEQR